MRAQALRGLGQGAQAPISANHAGDRGHYLAHVSKRGGSPATLSVVRAANKRYHATLPLRTNGRNLDLPTPEIRRLFQGARRKAQEAGRKKNKAIPWLVEDCSLLAGQL